MCGDTTISQATRAAELAAIVNGNASSAGDPNELLSAVLAPLAELSPGVRGYLTRSEDELRQALEQSAERRVVLVGGDGTLHAAVNAGVDLHEVALIPTGRANNVTRALGIPEDLQVAAELAATGEARPVDLLRVDTAIGTRYCVEALSAGLQADARSRYNGANSGDLRRGVQALAAALRRYEPYRVELTADGAPAYAGPAAQVFLSNLPFFGLGFRVDPVADPADGRLEAIVLPARTRSEAARLLVSTFRGSHLARPGVEVRRARTATLESPLPIACDGTPFGLGPASVTVEPGRLRLVAP
jgi:diacylglycerol kinase (ATP)